MGAIDRRVTGLRVAEAVCPDFGTWVTAVTTARFTRAGREQARPDSPPVRAPRTAPACAGTGVDALPLCLHIGITPACAGNDRDAAGITGHAEHHPACARNSAGPHAPSTPT